MLVDIFGDQALRAEYNPWESVDFHGMAGIVEGLLKSYETVRVASDVDTSSMSTVLQSPGNWQCNVVLRFRRTKVTLET